MLLLLTDVVVVVVVESVELTDFNVTTLHYIMCHMIFGIKWRLEPLGTLKDIVYV
jgi:predicted metal-dependent hydrolase